MRKTVFITGATSGIGKACAYKFAENNFDLVLTGRREERLSAIKEILEGTHNITVRTLCFDVQDREQVFKHINTIREQVHSVEILINNAGLALGKDSFELAEIDDWDTMMQTNVNGLLYVSKALFPLIKKNRGHIINIGSVAGKNVYENGSVYCASKFAVDAVTRGMRIDLAKFGVKVTSINPGAVETEFSNVRFKGNNEKADSTYEGFEPLTPQTVADTVFYCSQLPPNVCINDLTISCISQADADHIFKGKFVE